MIATTAFSFRPRPGPTGLLVLALPCLVGLGLWQLDRAQGREAAARLLDARAQAPALVLPGLPADAETLRDRHVAAVGRFEPDHQFLLDNRVRRGQAGYEVITPLRLADSELGVLVDRGWIPATGDRRQLPTVATPAGAVEVDGLAQVPTPWTFTLGRAGDRWEPVWQRIDLDRFQALTGMRVQPVVIRLAPASSAGGFERQWPRADAGADRNRSYAIQWFGFAGLAVALWAWSALERRQS